jgi:hypothetical protein
VNLFVLNVEIKYKLMLKTGLKSLLVFLIVFTTFKCIDPFYPKLDGYKSLLVVDGLLTNENRSYVVTLSLTKQELDSATVRVSDAIVSVTDETGNITPLMACGNGIYKTDSLSFRGEIGKSYRLHIKTSNGKEYESDSCTMLPVPGIDTIYYSRDVQLSGNQSIARPGLSVYLDTKPGIDDKYFLRWEFEETWKFGVPLPQRYDYINDSTILQISPAYVKEFCWKNARSSAIITGAILPGQSGSLKKQPVQFISTELSDRLSIRYSILIKQYSVSQKEYDYWNDLRQVNETEGDIFGSQPFAVVSNIKNINDPSEQVLGYFQVSAVEQKRKYISFDETIPLNLPFYSPGCKAIAKSPADYPSGFAPPPTFDEIYAMFMSVAIYTFVEPIVNQSGKLLKLQFTTNECANCEITGTSKKPDFWQDN